MILQYMPYEVRLKKLNVLSLEKRRLGWIYSWFSRTEPEAVEQKGGALSPQGRAVTGQEATGTGSLRGSAAGRRAHAYPPAPQHPAQVAEVQRSETRVQDRTRAGHFNAVRLPPLQDQALPDESQDISAPP